MDEKQTFLPLMNVEVVKLLRSILAPEKIQKFANQLGFRFDVKEYIEYLLQGDNSPIDLSSLVPGIGEYLEQIKYWISQNYSFFMSGDINEITEEINRFLLYQPKIVSLFGYSFAIYTTPKQLREYALYAGIKGIY